MGGFLKFQDLIALYEKKKAMYGAEAYRHISELLEEAKELHKKDWMLKPTPNRDHEQSWKAFKGKNLEKLVMYIIKDEVENLGLKVVDGNKLEKTKSENLSRELSQVKHNLLVDYGEFGSHLPDVDIIIYNPNAFKVIAVISSKVTLRERIAQTGYWKIKLSKDKVTEHIKVFFITPDEDRTLTIRKPAKKGRAIVEVDTDGSYVMSESTVEESPRVKMFDKFIEDLKKIISETDQERG
jgi:type II restriction enzyme